MKRSSRLNSGSTSFFPICINDLPSICSECCVQHSADDPTVLDFQHVLLFVRKLLDTFFMSTVRCFLCGPQSVQLILTNFFFLVFLSVSHSYPFIAATASCYATLWGWGVVSCEKVMSTFIPHTVTEPLSENSACAL